MSPRICVLLFVGCPFPRDELLGGWWRAKVAGLSERDGGLAYVQIVAGLCVVCEECVCAVGWAHPQLVVLWTKRIKLDLCIFCWLAGGELVRFRVPGFVCTDA